MYGRRYSRRRTYARRVDRPLSASAFTDRDPSTILFTVYLTPLDHATYERVLLRPAPAHASQRIRPPPPSHQLPLFSSIMASLAPPFVPQMGMYYACYTPQRVLTYTHTASGAASTSRQPPLLKRSSSAISLPSPPSDMDVDAHTDVEDDDEDIKAFAELETGPCRPQAYLDLEDEEEIDELDSDQDVDVTAERPSLRLVGNLETSQNPFLTTARAQTEAHTRAERSTRPDHPQASPTHLTQRQRQRRQRNVVDKIHCAPKLGHDSLSAKGTLRSPPKAMGADDLSNPFIDRPWEVTANTADAGSDSDSDREDGGRRRRSAPSEERKVWRKGQAQRPDKVTYVL